MIESREAYDGLTLMLITDEELVDWDWEECAETVEGEEAEELLDEDVDAWSREMLGNCGLALSVVVFCTGRWVLATTTSSSCISSSDPSSISSSSIATSSSGALDSNSSFSTNSS